MVLSNGLTTVIRKTSSCLKLSLGERLLEITHSQGSHGRDPKAAGGKLAVKSGSQNREAGAGKAATEDEA